MSQPEVDYQNSPMMVTVMTTEHFVLQTARSAGITETVGRAAIYLAAVSSGLIALAFVGQLSRLGAAFYVFGLVLLPTLAFVGVTTFDRALGWRMSSWPSGSTASVSSTSTPRLRSAGICLRLAWTPRGPSHGRPGCPARTGISS